MSIGEQFEALGFGFWGIISSRWERAWMGKSARMEAQTDAEPQLYSERTCKMLEICSVPLTHSPTFISHVLVYLGSSISLSVGNSL